MLQCSRRIRNALKRKCIRSLAVMSDHHIAKIFGVEYYPECISNIMLFIDEQYNENNDESKDNLDILVKETVHICSGNSENVFTACNSFRLVLEAHGWFNDSFHTEGSTFSATVFKTVLKVLYYSQIWKVIRLKERRDSNKMSSRGIYHDDDILALAFVPSILHSLVTQNILNLTKCPRIETTTTTTTTTKTTVSSAVCSSTTTFSGACVLADISGFTKMSAKFCEQGLSGLDDLHRNTSGFLGQYVQIVYAHGGDGKRCRYIAICCCICCIYTFCSFHSCVIFRCPT